MFWIVPLVLASQPADKIRIMISYVDHQLYIGEQADAESPPTFITAVLWTALDIRLSPPPNIVFARLPLREYTEPDPIDLEMGVTWLCQHLPEHHILVACRVGFGRSPSLIIAYLCCHLGLSFTEAQDLVAQKRPGTTPLPRLASVIEQLQSSSPAFLPRLR
ncbi:MAG: dual specificity protein phosphatase family protein [Nitrospirota bacterium]|nr:dual specificity protein phosphatase family protein [Nitrospirota bacterium]MDH5585566.1 dual specificity protein phosphatase family protein [Nitrospirota bacterium]MDH5773965.1 dual specificity protein phosphatase family protein [Nitrospirota bacterium]